MISDSYQLKWYVKNKLAASYELEITLKSFISIVRVKNKYGTEIVTGKKI